MRSDLKEPTKFGCYPNRMSEDQEIQKKNNTNVQQKINDRCLDYTKWFFRAEMQIDDGMEDRPMAWRLRFIMIYTMLMAVSALTSIFFSQHPRVMVDNVRVFLLLTMVNMSLWNEYYNRKALTRFHQYLNKSFSTSRTGLPQEESIIEGAVGLATKFTKIYVTMYVINYFALIFAQPLNGMLEGTTWKRLPFPWIGTESNIIFWSVFISQSLGLFISSLDGMVILSFTSVTIQMQALFEILVLSIKKIDDRCADKMSAEGNDRRRAIYACLKEDVMLHRELVEELISITPYLRYNFFALSLTISIVMACEAYPLIMGLCTTAEFFKGLVFLGIEFLAWAQTCFRMETMSDQNTAVFDALYETPWYESGVQYKKLMYTSVIYALRPMYITSPLFTGLNASMATFYSFTISSFNILNVIRNLSS